MNWLDNIGNEGDQFDELVIESHDEEKEWLKQRLGKVTGSQLGKLVVKDRKGGYKLSEGKVASDLLYRIAWERFLTTESDGMNRLNVSSREMQHGNDYELEAVNEFTRVTGIDVEMGGHRFKQFNDFFGGTPDGYIDDQTIIEVKAPWNGGNHLKTLLTGELYNDDHFYQIQGYMLITGANKCFYCTYDPDLPDGIKIAIVEVERDEDVIGAIKDIIDQCRLVITDLIEKVKTKL